MRLDVISRWFGASAALSLVFLVLGACNDDGANGALAPPGALPASDAGDGGPALKAYPSGPYGVQPGDVIANYGFQGFPRPSVDSKTLAPIELADFYNPHAADPTYKPPSPDADDRLFAKGSAYGSGAPKPTGLAIDVGAIWCGPCNAEAKTDLPPRHAKYKPLGGEFILQLVDGSSQGTAATQKDLLAWTSKYKVDYPGTIDPAHMFGALFDPNAFPENLIIDTRTMKIVEVVSGVPDESYWAKFEGVITGK